MGWIRLSYRQYVNMSAARFTVSVGRSVSWVVHCVTGAQPHHGRALSSAEGTRACALASPLHSTKTDEEFKLF
ncbi:hypothetical protein CRM22_001085 [Opisthorchis felineus]|uniref:Uncharacterized protein n=1 Tax=Opisthorchis felineus TaxID=147828 RepID=A0A4S2MC51_OPIFE|nr:hypothetical protein CRM22_001085 [Opisthorchis felineus]